MLIRFLFSILGQTERKMVHKTEIFFFTVALVGSVSLLLLVFQTTPPSRSKQTDNDTAAIPASATSEYFRSCTGALEQVRKSPC